MEKYYQIHHQIPSTFFFQVIPTNISVRFTIFIVNIDYQWKELSSGIKEYGPLIPWKCPFLVIYIRPMGALSRNLLCQGKFSFHSNWTTFHDLISFDDVRKYGECALIRDIIWLLIVIFMIIPSLKRKSIIHPCTQFNHYSTIRSSFYSYFFFSRRWPHLCSKQNQRSVRPSLTFHILNSNITR